MITHSTVARLLHILALAALLVSSTPPLQAQQDNTVYLPLINQPARPVGEQLLFRTQVTVQTPVEWRDLERLGVVILDQGDDWALVLADDEQLEALARRRYNPTRTNGLETLAAASGAVSSATVDTFEPLLAQARALQPLLAEEVSAAAARADLRAALTAFTAAQLAFLALAADVDSDNDGLTDDQEALWCTDPAKADSDQDGVADGAEVAALKAWMNNGLSAPPASGKPFAGWPAQKPDCPDDDFDAVPDLAERWELGLDPSRESTDRDKFDDGQELFGVAYCPGSAGFCGYGLLPRNEDWGTITAQMPAWVKAPGNHPLVAAFPVPEVDVVASSLKVEVVTTITTDHVISEGTERSYSTAKTEGTSTSVANTVSWNEWQEVSESLQQRLPQETIKASNRLAFNSVTTNGFWDGAKKWAGGSAKILVGTGLGLAGVNGCGPILGYTTGVGAVVGAVPGALIGAGAGLLTCGGLIVGGALLADSGVNDLRKKDDIDKTIAVNQYQNTDVRLQNNINVDNQIDNQVEVILNQSFDTSGIIRSLEGTRYAYLQTGEMISNRLYEISGILAAPTRTTSQSQGRSWGGSQSTTHEQYEEHTITNGEAFSNGESWGRAVAVNSAHAADLTFTYKVRNTGTEYAREVANLAFNLYIGDDPNPAITYFVAPDLGGAGKFQNFMPGEEHTYTSRRIPLSLEQMKAIDLGGPIRIVVEDFTYGIDELFYQDAANAGLLIAIEDGADDGDEAIDTYLIPTWGQETVLDVLRRYFPHETDANGMMTAIWTPEYRIDTPSWCRSPRRPTDYPSKALWCRHALSTADWWNVYTDGLGDGSEGFQDTPAAPGSVALFRFNKDSDLDGFSDRSERRLGTDPFDAASFPRPEVLAGLHSIRTGNGVVATLSLLNTGLYDAYGVEAIMVAPDDSISITNNTVGGSGRVRAQKQVIVGSRIALQSPLPAAWTQANHATPAAGGYYIGGEDRIYTFTVAGCGAGSCSVGAGSWTLNWNDGKGGGGSLNFGAGYQSPAFHTVGALGLTLALYSGAVKDGESFTVAARTPRDTFQYTINREPYSEPLVIVSYNDPQGNHRFVIPPQAMKLVAPTNDLRQFAGEMLHDVGVEIVTHAPFAPGNNTVELLANNPSDKTLQNAHLFLEFINISGTVVLEVPTQVTLPPGPTRTIVPYALSPTPPHQDYIVLAFLTDYQGNILDTAGRPLSSFQADPLPVVAMPAHEWNFGTVPQGTLLKYPVQVANTGFGRLYTYIRPLPGMALRSAGSRTVGAADLSDYELVLNTGDLPLGPYAQTLSIYTSDGAPPRTISVAGTITAPAGDTPGGAITRPLDLPITVTGNHNQGTWYDFTYALGPDSASLHPVKVYSQDYGTLYGVGNHATDFGQGTAASMFGDGRDGVMPGSGKLDYAQGFGAGTVNGNAGSTTISVVDRHAVARINPGDVVLIHQTRGSGAGQWELNKAVSNFTGSGAFTLQNALKYTYVTNVGNERAQILRVPQYTDCPVTGTVTPVGPWNGDWGGIFAVMCRDDATISGSIANSGGNGLTATSGNPPGGGGAGFRGGQGDAVNDDSHGCGFQGEGTASFGWHRPEANGNGGGAGCGTPSTGNYGTGGGGGNGTAGANSSAGGKGTGGSQVGNPELTSMVFGGGGAGSNDNPNNSIGSGGGGGGITVLIASNITLSGIVHVNGGNGGGNKWGAGGGAGGSALIRSQSLVIGTDRIMALGGNGGNSGGGKGGVGRIRIEYCEDLTGTTNPPASTQKLDCYIAEQTDPGAARLNLPEAVNGSRTYAVQFGRKLDFAAAGEQTTNLRVPAGMAADASLDVLLSNAGTGNLTLKLDIGADGSWECQQTQSVDNAATLTCNGLADAFNSYWAANGAPASGQLDVPVRLSLSKPAQSLITNLQIASAASRVRHIRLPVRNYTQFLLDFTVGESGSVVAALDIGDNGSIDWSTPAANPAPARWTTADLKTALNAYLSGKSGVVDVPVRFYVSPLGAVKLNGYTAVAAPVVDLAAASISVGGSVSAAALRFNEGEVVPVQATLRNPSSTASGPVTAAFFARAEGWGDWYIGGALVGNIPAGGSVTVSTQWNTLGFGGDVPVKVVVNPYGRLPETNGGNNSATLTTFVEPVKIDQAITFAPPGDKDLGMPSFMLNATASSGLPVSFTSRTPQVCTVEGALVTLRQAGNCTIRAEQAGNLYYRPAPPVDRTFWVRDPGKLDQTITFGALPDKRYGDAPFVLSATASSGLPVSFTARTPQTCTVSGNTVTLIAVGLCRIRAAQPGNDSYNPAPDVERSFTVHKGGQSIDFAPLADRRPGEAPFTLSATASSGLPVRFTAAPATVCTVSGNVVTLHGEGECTVTAEQAGDERYDPAAPVSQIFRVHPGVEPADQVIYLPVVGR